MSQEFTVQGVLNDTSNEGVAYASVQLFNKEGSQLVSATITDEMGLFEFQELKNDSYLLMASYAGENIYQTVIELSKNLDLGIIVVDLATQLEEVAVISSKPKFEQKADRYVYTIANTSVSQGDMFEALSRTPGMLLTSNQLTFKGESNIGVMINNKLINLPLQNVVDLLRGTSAGTVEAIEIITNPPAKFSAEGNILVNIKMNGNLIAGYNGSVDVSLGQGIFPKYSLSTNHFFKSKKTSTTLSYNYSDRKTWVRFLDRVNFLQEDNTITTWEGNQERVNNRFTHNLSLFFDYNLNEKTDVTFTMINSYVPNNNFDDIRTNTAITGANTEPFSSFLSTNRLDRERLNTSFYLEGVRDLGKNKGQLSTMGHFTYYDSGSGQTIENDFQDSTGAIVDEIDFKTNTEQQIRLYSLQTDYSRPLGKKNRFETGVKFAAIDSDNRLSYDGDVLTTMSSILANQGEFEYKENIYAAYLSYSSQSDDWRTSFGLRTEYTESTGRLDAENDIFKNAYLEWFPSFSIQHSFEKGKKAKLFYYRRITRPRYRDLNPFQLFQSFNSTSEGNPQLQPATRHYLAGSYSLNKWLTFELFYRNRKNQLRQLAFQDNENQLIRFISSNIDRQVGYGIDAIIDKSIGNFWQTYILGTYLYVENQFTDIDTGNSASINRWSFLFTFNNSFTLLAKKDLYLDIDYRYVSPYALSNATRDEYASLNISIQKKLWNDRGSISAGVTDLFSQRPVLSTRRFFNQNNTSFYEPETPIFRIGMRYKFGNVKIKDNKKRIKQQERNRL